MRKIAYILAMSVLVLGASSALADNLDYADAAYFKDLGANSGYGNCDINPIANPTNGASYTERVCTSSTGCPAAGCEGFHAPFLWPPSASISAGTCSFQIDAKNPSNDTSTSTWGVEVGCCNGSSIPCDNITYGTQRTMTLTDVTSANAVLITAVNGVGAAPSTYTGLAVGNWCDFRITRLHGTSLSDATSVRVLAGHATCQ